MQIRIAIRAIHGGLELRAKMHRASTECEGKIRYVRCAMDLDPVQLTAIVAGRCQNSIDSLEHGQIGVAKRVFARYWRVARLILVPRSELAVALDEAWRFGVR